MGASWVARDASFVPGSVCWIDVASTDPVGSRDFYRGLFGWTYQALSAVVEAQRLAKEIGDTAKESECRALIATLGRRI